MVTWDGLREIALALPGVEEGTSYGTPAFRVRGKFLARLWPEEAEVLVLRLVDPDEQVFLVRSHPETYFVTPHYEGHPSVLVRLGAVGAEELRELFTEAWRSKAPRRLVAAFDATR
jgi:hypothetical protein